MIPFTLLELTSLGIAILTLLASLASLAACFVYRRVSRATLLLMLGFDGGALVMLGHATLQAAQQFPHLIELPYSTPYVIYCLISLVGFGASVLTAVGLFRVLGDVSRRMGCSRPGTPGEDSRGSMFDVESEVL